MLESMKRGILAVFLCALVSCESMYDDFGYRRELHPFDVRNWYFEPINHDEPGWDRLGLWRRLEGSPPCYVPKDMARQAPVDEAHGTWIVDVADKSRFYVPKGGTPKYSEAVLKAEAGKVINHVSKARRRIGGTIAILICYPLVCGITFLQQGFRNMP